MKEEPKVLIKLLDKAEFRFSAVEAILFSKCMEWLKEVSEPKLKVLEGNKISKKKGK